MALSRRVELFQELSRLPIFNPAVVKLMGISSESDSAMEDFERVFESDPALSTDLLLMANSAAFGGRRHIETIKHALALLGLERVRGLALNIILAAYMRRQAAEVVRPIWLHAVATAVIAETLGSLRGVPGLYTLGLMHDLGRLALLSSRGQRYAEMLAEDFLDIDEALDRETAVLGMNHCDAGALLAGTWGFSERFQVCMVEHHGTPESKGPLGLIQTACSLADSLGYAEVRRREMDSPQALSVPGIESERILDRIKQQTAILVS
jgi:HD-like signal output (HDOD) protein